MWKIVYNMNLKSKPNTTDAGVPRDLLDLCVTSNENGDKVYERFVYEKSYFVSA